MIKDDDPANRRNPEDEPLTKPFQLKIEHPENVIAAVHILQKSATENSAQFLDPKLESKLEILLGKRFNWKLGYLKDKSGSVDIKLRVNKDKRIHLRMDFSTHDQLENFRNIRLGSTDTFHILQKISDKFEVKIQCRQFETRGPEQHIPNEQLDMNAIQNGEFSLGQFINFNESVTLQDFERFICETWFDNKRKFLGYQTNVNYDDFYFLRDTALKCISNPNAWLESPRAQSLWEETIKRMPDRIWIGGTPDDAFFVITIASPGLVPIQLELATLFTVDFCKKYGLKEFPFYGEDSVQSGTHVLGRKLITLQTETDISNEVGNENLMYPGMKKDYFLLDDITLKQLEIYRSILEETASIVCQAKGITVSEEVNLAYGDGRLAQLEEDHSKIKTYKKGITTTPPVISSKVELETEKDFGRPAPEEPEQQNPNIEPKTGFDLIGGQSKAVEKARTFVSAINNASEFTKRGIKPPKGMVLVGPPGTGKTLLARTIAEESNAEFIHVKVTDVMTKWYGESEGNITKFFDKARSLSKQGKKVILFFDQLEAIGRTRDTNPNRDPGIRIVSTLLVELDGLEKNSNVIFLGATESLEMIDKALIRSGRIDEIVELTLPTEEDLYDIFQIYLQNIKAESQSPDAIFDSNINWNHVASWAYEANFVGADVENILQIVIRTKVQNEISHNIPWTPVTVGEIVKTIGNFRKEKPNSPKLDESDE